MKPKSTVKELWHYAANAKFLLFVLIFSAFIGNFLTLYAPYYIGKAIDTMIGEKQVQFSSLWKLLCVMIALYTISLFFNWLMSYLTSIVSHRAIYRIRNDAFQKLHMLPVSYFDTHAHGNIVNILSYDMETLADGLLQGVTQLLSSTILIAGTLMFMLSISFYMTTIILLITPICFIVSSYIAKRSYQMFTAYSQSMGQLNAYISEIIENHTLIQSFNYETTALSRFYNDNEKLYKWGQQSQWYSSLPNPTTRYLNNIAYILVGIVGGYLSITAGLTVGKISSFIVYSNQFAKPINEITSVMAQFQSALASTKRIFSFIHENENLEAAAPIENEQNITPRILSGSITFQNVCFSYRSDVPLIRHLNLSVSKGQKIAIVGPTGSGKTTLVNLLMGFYSVDSGHIFLDNIELSKIPIGELRSNIGMILQETWLFHGTIQENIAFGMPDATLEQVIQASKTAYAHHFIKKLPKSYQTVIDEDGGNLSQGEKQLLTIARVILINPPILILDEATSSIDTLTELHIIKAFHQLMKGKTSFIIAHRLSTIKDADCILVLDHGNIIEQGTHQELVKQNGFYARMLNSRSDES